MKQLFRLHLAIMGFFAAMFAMVLPDPAQASQKWVTNLSGATESIRAGVGRVTTPPGQTAARNKAGWLAAVTRSADKWARNVAAVPLEEWKSKMMDVGVPRIASGATANQGKMTSFMTDFFPHLQAGMDRVKAMPKTNLEESIARSAAMIRHNATFQRRSRG